MRKIADGLSSFEPRTALLTFRDLSIDPDNVTDITGKLILVTEGRAFFPWAAQAQANGAAGFVR